MLAKKSSRITRRAMCFGAFKKGELASGSGDSQLSSCQISTLNVDRRNSARMMRSFPTGYEARGDHTMRAAGVWQKCRVDAPGSMHPWCRRVLLRTVESNVRMKPGLTC
jgi:hypothetical protein